MPAAARRLWRPRLPRLVPATVAVAALLVGIVVGIAATGIGGSGDGDEQRVGRRHARAADVS